jgi:hypothetical protein
MKSKLTVPKRNPFVCLVLKKTGAGSHRKPNKAQRKLNKQRDRSSEAEQGAFNAEAEISKFSGHTMLLY